MPFTILFFLLVIVSFLLIIFNLILPKINPKYNYFWMFREDKFIEKEREIHETLEEIELQKLDSKKNNLQHKGN